MIMEADWLGFVLVPWKAETLKGRRLVARYSVKVDEEKQLEAIRRLTNFLGTGYDFVRLVKLALGRFWRRFNRPMEDTTKLICSESVVRFLNASGATQLASPASWTPEAVFTFVQDNPELFQLEEELSHD